MLKLNKHIIFNYYSGNINYTKPLGTVTVEQFIKSHQNPTERNLKIFEQIQHATGLHKRQLKHQLYAFTPSVIINESGKRCYNDIISWTGIMQLDFDKLQSEDEATKLKHELFDNNPEIICSYLSPSRLGVKCLMRTIIPRDKEHYKAIHKAVCNRFVDYKTFDIATKNAVLPLFLSMDKDILFVEFGMCLEFDEEDWSTPDYVELNEAPKHNFNKHETVDYYYNKTIRVFTDKINMINDNGHPQLRSACLILGSRCAAGYMDINEAHSLAENLIRINNYLKKGTSGYLSTAHWAINEGSKVAKYY